MNNPPPQWGVMFHDGSVMHRWNGRTQRERAERAAREWAKQHAPDRITLAYRADASAPWERVEE
jgi:hypothetical protein